MMLLGRQDFPISQRLRVCQQLGFILKTVSRLGKKLGDRLAHNIDSCMKIGANSYVLKVVRVGYKFL